MYNTVKNGDSREKKITEKGYRRGRTWGSVKKNVALPDIVMPYEIVIRESARIRRYSSLQYKSDALLLGFRTIEDTIE